MIISVIDKENRKLLSEMIPQELLDDDCIIIGAYNEAEEVVGVAVSRSTAGRIWDIPFIYVSEKNRRKKTAHNMLRKLSALARTSGVSNLMISHIETVAHGDMKLFLASEYFYEVEASYLYEVPLSLAIDVIATNKHFSDAVPQSVIPLSKVSSREWRSLNEKINRLAAEDTGGNYFPIPYDIQHFNRDYSFIAMKDDRTPVGVILCSTDDTVLNIDYLCSLSSNSPMLPALLIKALCIAAGRGTIDYDVHFHAYNERILKLASLILGDKLLKKTGRRVTLMKSV